MLDVDARLVCSVHCRIGSSEILQISNAVLCPVHCRIGSSENVYDSRRESSKVHCRIGSSEMRGQGVQRTDPRSLPHRQLRKCAAGGQAMTPTFTAA